MALVWLAKAAVFESGIFVLSTAAPNSAELSNLACKNPIFHGIKEIFLFLSAEFPFFCAQNLHFLRADFWAIYLECHCSFWVRSLYYQSVEMHLLSTEGWAFYLPIIPRWRFSFPTSAFQNGKRGRPGDSDTCHSRSVDQHQCLCQGDQPCLQSNILASSPGFKCER